VEEIGVRRKCIEIDLKTGREGVEWIKLAENRDK
jgi:hypothetical protein